MEILKFIFVLGINFSIFGFIWGIIMFLLRNFQNPDQQKSESLTYVLRIVKYFLLVSVTANYIVVYENDLAGTEVSTFNIVLGSIVMALYLLGKLQNRAMMSQMSNNPMFARLMPKIDPKVERFLLAGSLVYFVICMWYPTMVDNGLINWFTNAIIGIYETPVIGWTFSVIAFFFLINILMRGANVIGNLLNGKSILDTPKPKGNFNFNGTPFGNDEPEESFEDEEGFTDYEDVTDEDDK